MLICTPKNIPIPSPPPPRENAKAGAEHLHIFFQTGWDVSLPCEGQGTAMDYTAT